MPASTSSSAVGVGVGVDVSVGSGVIVGVLVGIGEGVLVTNDVFVRVGNSGTSCRIPAIARRQDRDVNTKNMNKMYCNDLDIPRLFMSVVSR